jgi:flagellar biosynthesis protein FlhF
MKVKRFVAQDMRQAIRMVREALGPDAVILSNRSVADGIELTAAVDLEQTDLAETVDRRIRKRALTDHDETAARCDRPPASDPLADMHREMRELRRLMENELGELNWRDLGQRSPETRALLRRLLGLGLNLELAKNLASQLTDVEEPDLAWRDALYALANEIPIFDAEILERGGILALVGPTGVGKTTTIAKLAARFALRHGNRHVGLVSVDNFRIGARDQLHTYGRILNVPVRSAATSEELDTVIDALSDRQLIMIDTAGMGIRNDRFGAQQALLNDSKHAITRLLTLSANIESQALDRAVTLFDTLRPSACVLTKLDETAALGGILSTVVKHKLPLAFFTDGQRVPEDLQPARAHPLVNLAAELAEVVAEVTDPQYLAYACVGGRSHAQL